MGFCLLEVAPEVGDKGEVAYWKADEGRIAQLPRQGEALLIPRGGPPEVALKQGRAARVLNRAVKAISPASRARVKLCSSSGTARLKSCW